MPRRRTSLKSNRVNKRKHTRNVKVKNQLKKTIKKFQELLAKKDSAEAKAFITKVFSQLDKAAKKNIIHPGTANRKKSRLTLRLNKSA
ncbi:MAG: 30S ribosomal protein S20 [Candidatus Omnitrophica bacterium]|nr:30S ribosomal protein S20 [Candidatus Omnitrophota bacterium]MDD5042206.1 30S ribosomal protein S20 [Candidatus Omnitrophota bacterium]MDD5500061.1 30S ribosomal protein S20 [Candidatus Omnitrophota bacterium]